MPGRIPILRPPGRPDAGKLYESRESRAADKRFYASAAWLRLRRRKLSANPLCERCQAQGLTTAAAHVHHRLPRKQRPDLALAFANLESICIPCHNALGANQGDR